MLYEPLQTHAYAATTAGSITYFHEVFIKQSRAHDDREAVLYMVVTRSAGTFLHHDITAKYIIAMTQIDRDENFLPLILTLTNLPLLLLSAQAQLLLHQPNLTHILHHASQRRRI